MKNPGFFFYIEELAHRLILILHNFIFTFELITEQKY